MITLASDCLSIVEGSDVVSVGIPPSQRSDRSPREVSAVTEIPEHLLNRSKARRAEESGVSTSDTTPAVATPAASTAPAQAKQAPAPKAVVQDPAYVVAAKTRKKIPFWAMTTLALLPAWAMLYLIALKPADAVVTGPLAIGAETYGSCAGCHGADGAGGAGRALYQGEVMKTFPHIEDMLNFVYTGSQQYVAGGIMQYGDPKREGGAHVPLSYNGNPMPMQGEKAGGALTDAQILSVVCHERYTISGTDPHSEEWAPEFETWCSADSEIFKALEAGTSTFDSIEKDFAALAVKPGAVGTAPRASISK